MAIAELNCKHKFKSIIKSIKHEKKAPVVAATNHSDASPFPDTSLVQSAREKNSSKRFCFRGQVPASPPLCLDFLLPCLKVCFTGRLSGIGPLKDLLELERFVLTIYICISQSVYYNNINEYTAASSYYV